MVCSPFSISNVAPSGYSINFTNPAWPEYTSGMLHSATIEDLEPSGTFYYSCGDEDLALSTVRQFNTPGAVGPNQTITFGVLGDLGQTNDSRWGKTRPSRPCGAD